MAKSLGRRRCAERQRGSFLLGAARESDSSAAVQAAAHQLPAAQWIHRGHTPYRSGASVKPLLNYLAIFFSVNAPIQGVIFFIYVADFPGIMH